jgi:hypothetical protein
MIVESKQLFPSFLKESSASLLAGVVGFRKKLFPHLCGLFPTFS